MSRSGIVQRSVRHEQMVGGASSGAGISRQGCSVIAQRPVGATVDLTLHFALPAQGTSTPGGDFPRNSGHIEPIATCPIRLGIRPNRFRRMEARQPFLLH
jgi:hypothetical protein